MSRTKGSKNKKTITKTTTKNKNVNRNTNINNVHVHVEKTKTRKKRTTKPKVEINNNPLSNLNQISKSASQNIGFHPRGLINNEIQQPSIIQIQPTAQVEELEKKLKKYKEKLKSHKTAQDTTNQNLLTQLSTPPQQPNITVSQPPINVNVNPFKQIKEEKIEKLKTPLKKSVVRFPKSRTKAGAAFKPSDLDETTSIASSHQTPSQPQQEASNEEQTKAEKKLESRFYALKGSGVKPGAIINAEIQLSNLKEQLKTPANAKQKKSLEIRIEKKQTMIKELHEELQKVELKLNEIRGVKPHARKGIMETVASLFSSPAKCK